MNDLAPEVLKDLAGLLPTYQGATRYRDDPGIYLSDWEGLCESQAVLAYARLEDLPPGRWRDGLKALDELQHALVRWATGWNLNHPRVLDWALQHLDMWARMPEHTGKPIPLYWGPVVVVPPTPRFTTPEFALPIHGGEKTGDWRTVEARLREAVEAWLGEYRALWHAWALPNQELQKHARWWVLRVVKGLSYTTIADQGEEPLTDDAVRKAVERLSRELSK
ncbi:hypothetical protein [Meiothermus sp. PNK-Is4]|uniref:hypothetical protein n=1 Tax=Meiothermus sp. PNK-Is4 TaxID=2740565 RepID=UPI0011B4D874|nr:hypothetical protein [Meiothermus sp. PNK-Is4]